MQVPQVSILARSWFTVAVSPLSSCPSKLGLMLATLLQRAWALVHDSKSLQMLLANFLPALGELEDHIRMLMSPW